MTYKNQIQAQIETLKNAEFLLFEEPLRNDPAIKRNEDSIKFARKETIRLFNEALEITEKAILTINNEYIKWNATFLVEKKKYEEHIRNAGGDRKGLEAGRQKVLKEIEDLEKRYASLSEQIGNLKNIRQSRDVIIEKLFRIYEEYSQERKSKCQNFESESGGRLQVKIEESTNIDEFKNRLKALKRGLYLRDAEIEKICSKIGPNDFILDLLRYEASDKDIKYIQDIAKKTNIEFDRLHSLCDFLISEVPYEELLQLQYRAHPQDRPEIKFRLTEDVYELIRDISVGQKCTAMLIMALGDGKFPVVIDQPEDSLDVRSVWDDMCVKIRTGKENRQFIFTTHNSCLAVASDTDKFIIVEGSANKGFIVLSGALETAAIKEEVIKYLEGGRPTYEKKASKYGM